MTYRSHIEDIGWESKWNENGEISGTEGKAKQLEAIQIKLTGEIANEYDVYYRVHAQEFGWLGWATNGESAGTAGYNYQLEAVEIKLVKKGEKEPEGTGKAYIQKQYVNYSSHVEDIGWQAEVYDGKTAGTTGQAKQIEAIKIELENSGYEGSVRYQSHIEDYGWENSWKKDGEISGTEGKAKQLEAIKIELTGEMKERYDIYYRVHVEDYGWMDWKKDGEISGTVGEAKRIEAIEIKLVDK